MNYTNFMRIIDYHSQYDVWMFFCAGYALFLSIEFAFAEL